MAGHDQFGGVLRFAPARVERREGGSIVDIALSIERVGHERVCFPEGPADE